MGGDDEARARAVLGEMQSLLSRGPHVALGVAEISTPEQVRAAFLSLTKQFHPARFGRLSHDVQRMSNEVFLGIKAAHDAMLRALGASLRPGGGVPMPHADAAAGSSRVLAPPAAPRGASAPTGGPALPRTRTAPNAPTPPVSTTPPPMRATAQMPPLQRPPARDSATSWREQTPARMPQPARTTTPPTGIPSAAQPGSQPNIVVPRTTTPLRPRTDAPNAQSLPQRPRTDPPNTRFAPTPSQPPPVVQFDETAALEHAKGLLARRDWTLARQALHALAARVPQSRPYRALLCYARGREAAASGKSADAATEYQRALQLDPALAAANQALAELKRR